MPETLPRVVKNYHDVVRRLPCGVCGAPGPSYAHHVRMEQGTAMRAGHFMVVPLCHDCHQGPRGIHGDRSLWDARKKTEADVLNDTIGFIFIMERTML